MGRGSRTSNAQQAGIANEQIRGALTGRSDRARRDPAWTDTVTRPAGDLLVTIGVEHDGTIRKGATLGVYADAINRLAGTLPEDVKQRLRGMQLKKTPNGRMVVMLRLVSVQVQRDQQRCLVCEADDPVIVRVGRHQIELTAADTAMSQVPVADGRTVTPDTMVELTRPTVVTATAGAVSPTLRSRV